MSGCRQKTLRAQLVAVSLFLLVPPASAGDFTGDWLELIDTTKLPVLRDSRAFQVSSYDRFGGNNDGFLGTFSFLRIEDGNFVLFDDEGPGCIYRIWSANPGLNRIEFYFDGEQTPRLVFDRWLDMFRDDVEPFVGPVSSFALGGCVSYVPIPYATSLKVIARNRPKFYQITYQKFGDSEGVRSFEPEMDVETRGRYERVLDAWNSPGSPPWPEAIERETSVPAIILAGSSRELISLEGPGCVYSLDLEGVDQRDLRGITLRITADENEAQVVCPLDAFFLWGPGPGRKQSLLAGRREDGSLYSYWPMPFRSFLAIEVENRTAATVAVDLIVGYREETAESVEQMGLFHARYAPLTRTQFGTSYEILQHDGRGHWCGMNLFMRGTGFGSSFLEGDERVRIDGRSATTYHGTGTEDYFNGGWYFGGTGWQPLWGCTRLELLRGRCDAYRLHFADAVPFQESIRVDIEHGNRNRVPARYGCVAFYYAAPSD
jgi:hypothetical protein